MNILFVLIPLSLVLLGVAIWALFWAIDSGQFEDLDAAAKAPCVADDDDRAPGLTMQTSPAHPAREPSPRHE